MRTLAVLLAGLWLSACGGTSTPTPGSKLLGNWLYASADGTSGLGATFRSDGTYTLVTIALTSTTTGNAEIENGGYVATDSSFTATPSEWTCPSPDPVTTVNYSFSGADLVAQLPTAVLILQPNPSTAQQAFALTLGCFQTGGAFVVAPLAPVSTQ